MTCACLPGDGCLHVLGTARLLRFFSSSLAAFVLLNISLIVMKSCFKKKTTSRGSFLKDVRFSRSSTEGYPAEGGSLEEHLLSLVDFQRRTFEMEHELFAGERQAWKEERALLMSRIAELEALLSGGGRAEKIHPPSQKVVDADALRLGSPASLWDPPISWNLLHSKRLHKREKALDDGRSTPPFTTTRSDKTDSYTVACASIPIEKLDGKLDGIKLKSTALPSEVVARVLTSPPAAPTTTTTATTTSKRRPTEHKSVLKLKLSELGPPDKNLTMDAGHTPMAAVVDADADADRDADQSSPQKEGQSNGVGDEQRPLTPPDAKELPQPTEKSESYFPDLPEDPSLKGPLSLLNDENHDNGFLKELNEKLLSETRQDPSLSSNTKNQDKDFDEPPSHDGSEPELKFKNATNFGTAFGESSCGRW